MPSLVFPEFYLSLGIFGPNYPLWTLITPYVFRNTCKCESEYLYYTFVINVEFQILVEFCWVVHF